MKKFSKNKKYFLQWAIRLPIKDVLYRQITVKEVACYKAGIKGEKEYENKSNTSKMNSRRKAENAKENPFEKLEKLPEYIELFEFYHPYKHIIFDKMEQDIIQKKLKDFCQVKVSMAI